MCTKISRDSVQPKRFFLGAPIQYRLKHGFRYFNKKIKIKQFFNYTLRLKHIRIMFTRSFDNLWAILNSLNSDDAKCKNYIYSIYLYVSWFFILENIRNH